MPRAPCDASKSGLGASQEEEDLMAGQITVYTNIG
jgi:hypothetical protein